MNSLRFKLICGFLAVTLPLIAMLFFGNRYAIGVVRSQVSESYKNMANLYLNQIDNSLYDVENYLGVSMEYDDSFPYIDQVYSGPSYEVARVKLLNKLKKDITVYKIVNCFFSYSPQKNDYIDVNNNNLEYMEREKIRNFIKEYIKTNNAISYHWKVVEINRKYYLIRITNLNNWYFGAWIEIENLNIPMSLIDLGKDGYTLFTSDDGKVLTGANGITNIKDFSEDVPQTFNMNGRNIKYQVITEGSKRGNFNLNVLIPEKNILNNLPYLQRIVLLILLITITIVPIGLYAIRKAVLVPLMRLTVSMKKVKNGNLDVRIQTYSTSDEFEAVNETFNTMVTQIQTLQLSVTKEQINAQREELYRLQMQQNPHFFMNSLNILYSLTKARDFKLMEEMTLCIISYFRFVFRNNLNFVLCKDEIEHCKNYLRIQELRFQKKLTYSIFIPDFLSDTPVPPLILQTFIENSVKHAVTLSKSIHISIEIDFFELCGEQYIKIVISDTGKGFSQEQLNRLQSGDNLVNSKGEHTGIMNIRRRLYLLYKNNAWINFLNNEGATVEITLPIKIDVKRINELG